MQFLITSTVVVILLVGVASSCHSVCNCNDSFIIIFVDCSGRRLNSIPTDLPDNTTALSLENNGIAVIEAKAFNNLPNLRILDLSWNKITSIKSNTLSNLTNLIALSLENNGIAVIEAKTFNNLPNLRFLDLSWNKITSIKSDTFSNLTNLIRFDLSSNKITSIKSDTFSNLRSFRWLSLYDNNIAVIEAKAFNNLPKLQHLWLQDNDISVIEANTFNNLPNLEDLLLQDNDISKIEANSFNNLPKLEDLRLQNNNISVIEDNVFNNLPNLRSLAFNMYCGGCYNIKFWRWVKLNQKFPTNIRCYDYNIEPLTNLQPANVTDCFTCVDGKYGQGCSQDCYTNCYDNTCHAVSGVCVYGCRRGWMGTYCKQLTPTSADNYTAVYTGVATFVAIALVAVIVFATLRYRKMKRQQRRQTYEIVTFDNQYSTIVDPNTDDNIPVEEEELYETVD